MLFRLPEYDVAAKLTAFTTINEFAMMHAPSLRLFPARPVPHVPITRIDVGAESPMRIAPTSHTSGGRFDVRAVVAGQFDDLISQLDTAAQATARERVRYMQGTLDQVTEATGNVVHGKPSWETLMAMLEDAPVGFDAEGKPTFKIIAGPSAAEKFDNLPEPSAEQLAAWEALMERKRNEFRARQRHRRLS